MKLLFDQNISHRVLGFLPSSFLESSTVKKENLIDSSDSKIWSFAKANGFTIVTIDSDFNDLNALFGHPPKIIWLRTKNLKTYQAADILKLKEQEIKQFLSHTDFGILEITPI